MKKLLFSIAVCAVALAHAQKKPNLIQREFWQSKPKLEQIKAEVAKGFDFKNTEGVEDPLLMAIMNDADTEIIKFLIEQPGIELSKPFFHERTYLHLSAQKGRAEIVEYLIKKGANMNALDDKGTTPITYAANAGNIHIIEIFTKNGVDLFHKFKEQNDANLLLLSIGNDKDFKITDYLLSKGFKLNTTDKNGNGVFYYASFNGNLNILKELVKKGVKYDDRALLAAAQGAHRVINKLEVYQYLIEDLKLNPKVVSENGETLLHLIASKPNQQDIVQYLLSKGVDAKKVDKIGNTAFLNACKGKSVEVVKMLFPFAGNIHAKNSEGENAMLNAVKHSNAEVIDFLINNGAKVDITDIKGNNLAYILVESYQAPRRGDTKDEFTPKLQLLAKNGIDFSKILNKGNTIYHLAATKNDLDLFKKLEGVKANINAKNEDGLTALHKSALVAKDDKALQYLLSLGADKNIKTDFDETAYDLAKDNEILSKRNINIEFLK